MDVGETTRVLETIALRARGVTILNQSEPLLEVLRDFAKEGRPLHQQSKTAAIRPSPWNGPSEADRLSQRSCWREYCRAGLAKNKPTYLVR